MFNKNYKSNYNEGKATPVFIYGYNQDSGEWTPMSYNQDNIDNLLAKYVEISDYVPSGIIGQNASLAIGIENGALMVNQGLLEAIHDSILIYSKDQDGNIKAISDSDFDNNTTVGTLSSYNVNNIQSGLSTLILERAKRRGITFYNNSIDNVYIKYDSLSDNLNLFVNKIKPDEFWEPNINYTGDIYAFSQNGSGELVINVFN